jgi:hypothetical protein
MPRTIYLAVFSNGRRPAHWAIFVPNTEAGNVGKLIHVTGSPAAGFFLGFKREYDFGETHQQYRLIPLAAVEECFVATPKADAPKTIDDTPCDRLEMVAKIVDPPPSCSNPFDPSVCRLTILR